MHSLKDLQDYFGWSYVQARKRVMWLKDNFSSEVKGGQNRKYQVTDNGFTYLERLNQLERNNIDLNSAQSKLLEELENPEEESVEGKAKPDKVSPKYVELLEQRVEELKEDKARLQEKVDSLENRLLPPEGERRSLFQRFWEWFGL